MFRSIGAYKDRDNIEGGGLNVSRLLPTTKINISGKNTQIKTEIRFKLN